MWFTVMVLIFFAVRSDAADHAPKVNSASNEFRGGSSKPLTATHIQKLSSEGFPTNDNLTASESAGNDSACEAFNQPGFYADISAEVQCRAFYRCDFNGKTSRYVCPGRMLFNQITLVCDWWYNVNCSNSEKFFDYSNQRLYTITVLLDGNNDYSGNGTVDSTPSGGLTSTTTPLPKRHTADPGLNAERKTSVASAATSPSSEATRTTSSSNQKRESTSGKGDHTTKPAGSARTTNTTTAHAAQLEDLLTSSLGVLELVYPQLKSDNPAKDWTGGVKKFSESEWIGFCQEALAQAGSDAASPDLPAQMELERLRVAGLAVSFCRKFYDLTKLPDVPHPMDSIIRKLSSEWDQAGQIDLPKPS